MALILNYFVNILNTTSHLTSNSPTAIRILYTLYEAKIKKCLTVFKLLLGCSYSEYLKPIAEEERKVEETEKKAREEQERIYKQLSEGTKTTLSTFHTMTRKCFILIFPLVSLQQIPTPSSNDLLT